MQEELESTFVEECLGAKEEFQKNRYKNAAILFSKSLFALCDSLIYNKLKKLPKNHGERFRILEQYFPDVYQTVDKLFSHYTDAYSKPVLKKSCQEIQKGIKSIIKKHEISKRIKETVE